VRLEEAALEQLGQGMAGGRWLLAVLAQIPGVIARAEPLALEWSAPPATTTPTTPTTRRRRSRRTTARTSPTGRAKS
jgi:hypothetical protein